MPALLIDSFDLPAPWSARTPADAPSGEIVLAADSDLPPSGHGAGALRLGLSAASAGHFIRRNIAATDLTGFPDLLVWCRGALPATGAPGAPHRLRIELGSAALQVGAVGNNWHRYMHLPRAGHWTHQRLALDDLAPAVRNAVDTIVFRVADPGPGTDVWLEGLFASDPGISADADAALLAALDGQLQLGGAPVPAAVAAPGFAAPPAPWIRLVQYDASYGTGRGNAAERQTDFTDTGHRLRHGAEPWDICYRVDFVTAVRAEQAAMVDFVLNRLGFFSQIAAGGRAMRVHRIPNVMPDDALGDGPLLRFRVEAWAEAAASRPVLPVVDVTLDLDQPGAA